jgi:hypothetical protein
MKKHVLLLSLFIVANNVISAQCCITGNPDSASIITADIAHFWRAFDLLKSQKSLTDSQKIIKTIFVGPASEGLRQYMQAAGCHEKEYLETIRKRKRDYLAVRAGTEGIEGKRQLVMQYLHKFKQLYPALRIPAICFTIGKFEVGGTQFENTLYIGCEVDILNQVDVIAQGIHELAHFQQQDQHPATNLHLALIEGGAEYVCYQVTGHQTIPVAWKYGMDHEAELWSEFRLQLDTSINRKWFSELPDKSKKRPGSLAYFIGFRICEAYRIRQRDQETALQEIIEMDDPKKVFRGSLYHP